MLELMSMFSNQMVPRGLLETAVDSTQAFDDVMLPLLQYHLVSERHSEGMYDVHHIVQLATKTFIGDNITNVRRKALSTLAKFLPPVDFQGFAMRSRCSPHVSELYKLEFTTPEECLELASTLLTMSLYWRLVSLFPKSEEAISRASAIRQELLGDEDFLTIQAQARHARVLWDLGREVESEALARSLVNRCEKLADEDDRNNPALCRFVGSVYNTLGDALIHLGRYKAAEDELRRCLSWYKAFDESSDVALSAKMSLTNCYLRQSAYQSAEDLCRQLIRDFDGSDDESGLSRKLSRMTLARIYSATLRLNEAALLFRETQSFFEQMYGSENNAYFLMELELVSIEARKGRYERVLETTESLTRSLTRIYGEQHQHNLTTLVLRAEALRQTGRAEEGIELHLRILKVKRIELGDDHPETLASSKYLAAAYFKTDRYSQALKMYKDLIPAANITFGPDHVETCQLTIEYGYALRESGRVDDALQQLEQVQEYVEKHDDLRRRKLRQQLYFLIGQCRFDMEQYEQALMYYDRALNSLTTLLDDDFWGHCNIRWEYAFTVEKMGHDAKSMKMYQDILHEAPSRPDRDGVVVIKSKEELAHCLRRRSKYAEAQAMYEELIEADYGWRIDRKLNIKSDLGLTLRFRGLLAEAEASDRKLLQERMELSPNNHKGIYLTMNNLGMTLWQRESYDDAVRWLSQAVEGRSKVLGPTHKDTIFCKMNLVEILASQQNWRRSDEVFDEVVKSLMNEFDLQHFRHLAVYRDILRIWMNAEKYEKVAALESALVDSFAQCFGAEHEDTLWVFGRIAEGLGKVGELQRSKNLFARLYASEALPKVLGAKETFCFKYATILVQLSDTETLESFSRTLAEEIKTASGPDSDGYSYSTVILSKALQDQKRYHECLAIQHERLLGAAKCGTSSPNFTICFQAYLGTAGRHWLLAPQTEATILKYLDELLMVLDPSLDVLSAIRAVGNTLWHHSHPKAVEVFESLLQNQNWLSKHTDEQRFDLRIDVMTSMHPAGKFEQGVALAEDLLSEPEFSVDRKAPRTLRLLSDLAMTLADAGRFHEAELYSLEAYEGRRNLLGSSHPHTLISKTNYSIILRLCGRYCASKKLIEEVVSERQKLTDAEDFGLFNAENHLIAVLLAPGQASEALKTAQVSWSDDVKKLGPKLRWRLNRKALLAQAKSALGKHLEAKILAENVMRQRQRLSGAKHMQTISSMYDVASIQLKLRKPKEAERLAVQALALMEAEYGDDYLLSLQLRQVFGRHIVIKDGCVELNISSGWLSIGSRSFWKRHIR